MNENVQKVATVDEFDGHGSRVVKTIDGREIAVFYVDDEYFTVLDYCTHEGGPLSDGTVAKQLEYRDGTLKSEREKCVRCPWHGWTFDLKSGDHVLDDQYRIQTFETTEVDGEIYVSLS